jgi:hypothetical protein
MSHNLSANFARPQQQIRQGIANFVFWELRNRSDLFLSVRAAPYRFTNPIRWGKLPQHPGDSLRRKGGFAVK